MPRKSVSSRASADCGLGLLKSVQHAAVGGIPDGVDGRRDACHGGPDNCLFKLLLIYGAYSVIAWITLIRLKHLRGLGAERAVAEYLDGADAQPLRAEACAQAQADSLVQPVIGDKLHHPHGYLACRIQPLYCGE